MSGRGARHTSATNGSGTPATGAATSGDIRIRDLDVENGSVHCHGDVATRDGVVGGCVLVVAKAPVPGRAKTRLGCEIGDRAAARLAAAALLDTLDAVLATPGAVPVVALTGSLAAAERADEIAALLERCTVVTQRGDGLGERLANAHADVAAGFAGMPVMQIGMDTPQVRPARLAGALAALRATTDAMDEAGEVRMVDPQREADQVPAEARAGAGVVDAVLGQAADGGWWGLGLRSPAVASVLRTVPMSRGDTGMRTLLALRAAGLRVGQLPVLSDVDTLADAVAVAALVPDSRFAEAMRALEVMPAKALAAMRPPACAEPPRALVTRRAGPLAAVREEIPTSAHDRTPEPSREGTPTPAGVRTQEPLGADAHESAHGDAPTPQHAAAARGETPTPPDIATHEPTGAAAHESPHGDALTPTHAAAARKPTPTSTHDKTVEPAREQTPTPPDIGTHEPLGGDTREAAHKDALAPAHAAAAREPTPTSTHDKTIKPAREQTPTPPDIATHEPTGANAHESPHGDALTPAHAAAAREPTPTSTHDKAFEPTRGETSASAGVEMRQPEGGDPNEAAHEDALAPVHAAALRWGMVDAEVAR
jgi:uncharacterized protein